MHRLNIALNTIRLEGEAIASMGSRLGNSFSEAVDIILRSNGRVVLVGMGKSGIVAQKIAATFASTGQTSFFVHPGEAYHGDLGMIRPGDVALLISNSGETEEVIRLLPFLQHQGNVIIALTGGLNSSLSMNADVVLDVGVQREACTNNLAPTSSTTCTMVMGDALALALASERNFQPEDFARFHPGGSLGRKLLCRVGDLMRKQSLPFCTPNDAFRKVIQTITGGRLGLALVKQNEALIGIITDGDIRRAFENYDDCKHLTAEDCMSTHPITVPPVMRVLDAEQLMLEKKISSLVVIEGGRVVGVFQIFDQI